MSHRKLARKQLATVQLPIEQVFRVAQGFFCSEDCIAVHFVCPVCRQEGAVESETLTEFFSARCETNEQVFLVRLPQEVL